VRSSATNPAFLAQRTVTLGAGTANGQARTDKPKVAAAPDLADCDWDRAASRLASGHTGTLREPI
jgi:hypothetical protein